LRLFLTKYHRLAGVMKQLLVKTFEFAVKRHRLITYMVY